MRNEAAPAMGGLARLWIRMVDSLSFSEELHRLRRELNASIDSPGLGSEGDWTHPLGVMRWFRKRRVSLAEAYVRIAGDLDSSSAKSRLRSLRRLMELSYRSPGIEMPLNTARVQLALIKETVKCRGDRRRQLELLYDFSRSTRGRYQVVRRLLAEHGLVELPETGERLRDLDSGRDGNVHDSSTTGRKNATQLLVDAFIKGISELTLACGDLSSLERMKEAVEAGRLVGVRVSLGIEFGLDALDRRFHFMAVLPPMERGSDVERFFKAERRLLRRLAEGLEEDQESRVESIRRLLSDFDRVELPSINSGYPRGSRYRVPRLRMRDLAAFVPLSRVAKAHLGDFLFSVMERPLLNRVLMLKARSARVRSDLAAGRASADELGRIEGAYRRARDEYSALDSEDLLGRYFSGPSPLEHSSAFDDLGKMSAAFREARCLVRLIRPLEHGSAKALALLESARGLVDEAEVYNVRDCAARGLAETREFCEAVNAHNASAAARGGRPIVAVCGSDASGRGSDLPGMGFVFSDRISPSRRKARAGRAGRAGRALSARWERGRLALPPEVAILVRAGGKPADLSATRSAPVLYSMGRASGRAPNRVGDEPDAGTGQISPARALRYLNPAIVDLARAAIGFAVARAFIGDGYALLWLGITAARNVVADLIAARGSRLRSWTLRAVDFDNLFQSLFWTGFSVPILGLVKEGFDQFWPLAAAGLGYNAVKFFFISGANGLYIAAHNAIRGFDRRVRRVNFFRSALSWPFAAVFAPLFGAAGIPSIVQAKIWSDVVAGFIEGGGKYLRIVRQRRRELEEILPRIAAFEPAERYAALFELLLLWRAEPRTRDSLARAGARLGTVRALVEDARIERRLVDYAIDEYPRGVAVELALLAATSLQELRAWLETRP